MGKARHSSAHANRHARTLSYPQRRSSTRFDGREIHPNDIPTALALPDWLPKIMKSLILGTAKSIHYEGSLDPVSSDDAYDSPADGGNTPEDWRDSWEKLILENLAAGRDVH